MHQLDVGRLRAAVRRRLVITALAIESLTRPRWRRDRKHAVLIGAPFHSNLGDQAQTMMTKEWIRRNYPEHDVIVLDSASASARAYALLSLLGRKLADSDPIFLHSGYHTTDLYPLENELQKEVIRRFPRNAITVLPQTIQFDNDSELRATAEAFNAHERLTVLARDEHSFALAQQYFHECTVELYPDIVTRAIGSREFVGTRSGIQLCLRNDAESVFMKNGLAGELHRRLALIADTELTDTNSDLSPVFIRKNLQKVISATWEEFAKYRLTVTDRYHGTIFSLIAGTPVIVLRSSDHKLVSGVKWFPEDKFGGYVYYAETVDEAAELAERIYTLELDRRLPDYFERTYYSQLKQTLLD